MLNSKQRAYLRSLATGLDTIFQIGKAGISPEQTDQISNALEARELIKLRVLENCEYSAKEAAEIIAGRTHSEVVCAIGTRFVLYRRSKKKQRIVFEQ